MTRARRDTILNKTFFGIVAITVALLSPADAIAQKVKFDYDKSANFAPLKTYAWIPGTPASNPNVDLYIMSAVDQYFEKKGFTKVAAKHADFLIVYHAARDTECGRNRQHVLRGLDGAARRLEYYLGDRLVGLSLSDGDCSLHSQGNSGG